MRAKYALAGALSFWGPGWVFAALSGKGFADFVLEAVKAPALRLTLLTLWPALLCLLVYFALLRRRHESRFRIASWMLVGLWCLGPSFILMQNTLLRGSLDGLDRSTLLLALPIPILTYILATYDGTLFALFLVTIVLLFCRRFYEKKASTANPVAA